ncbi:nose resistant to fluoxetine protein 6-like [Culicoides brevitarsis]|uniref:nose resistant to fluoxetine protein 6-like n=1 Tax=Culicoides brevitarsis TaxID=469753 RepID=UPI00307B7BCE
MSAKAIVLKSVFNLTEYYKMPIQNDMDDYTRCMVEGDDSMWCSTYTIIKPNRSNEVWNIIEKYSNDTKRHYRHDLVQKGVCIKWCLDKLKNYDNETLKSLYVEPFDFGDQYHPDFTLYYNATQYKEKYDYYVSICRNIELMEEYGLQGHSGIYYCHTELEDKSPDVYDWAFVVVVGIILLVLLNGTVLDVFLNKKQDIQHYENSVKQYDLPIRLLLAFSIPRNWYRLKARPKSQEARDLRYIQGLRSITTVIIIIGHVTIVYAMGPIVNTEYFEGQFYHIWEAFYTSGMNVVQTFIAISGFLMGVQFFDLTEKKKFNFNYFWIAIIYRYIRLTPMYALVIFFEATWQYKLDDGPLWKLITEGEKSYCRRNWWANLLYVNNYVNANQACLVQSWYLSVDFQLFIVGLLVVMAMWKYPQYRNKILYACLFISYTIPAVVTYVLELDGVFTLTPHERKFIYNSESKGFLYYYIPAHTNAGNYFAGLGMALLYNYFKKNRIDISKYKSFVFGFYAIFPIGLLAWLSAFLFYTYEFEKPALWIALFAVFSKNIWGILGAFLMFGFIGGIGGIIRRMFYMPIFGSIGRLTYCIYLIHMCVFRFLNGDIKRWPSVSWEPMLQNTFATFTLSLLLAIVLCVTLEFPFTALLKEVYGKLDEENPEEKRQNNTHKNTRKM